MNTHVHISHSVLQVAPLMDKGVEIHGTSRADINGKRGVATDFHYYEEGGNTGRYTVPLDSGGACKGRRAAVRAEGTGGGGGAGKAKGKGKKGKKGRGGRS